MNFRLNEQIKSLEQRNSNCKYQLSAVKNIITDKNNEILNLKEELISVEFFKNDKDKYTKQIKFLEEKLFNYKADLDKKTKRLRQLEKLNSALKLKSDEFFIENKLIKTDNPHKTYIEMLSEKQRVIRNFEKENLILKNEIEKYDRNFEVLITHSTCKEAEGERGKDGEKDNKFDIFANENKDVYNNLGADLNEGKNENDNLERVAAQEANLNGKFLIIKLF